ncbi:related to chicken h-caldesmon, Uso1p and YKL201c [Phialocephala subalpina]|uniref:Related to chicken h-caldesmon, Uso1p and YKL201c n=1 Tax=Phialocephala subalpina TaxID=576137 RepID=A0A1L7X3Q5_9HELO|nr:related to chicken h-caldesmon, Uso1p and YKL201c [Phialocephala subalpina]
MPSDLEQLLEFGFEKERAEIAVKKTGGLQAAIDWLDANQEKTIEELRTPAPTSDETDPSIEPAALKEGEVANSLICDDCGKKFRSTAQAEVHAERTSHQNFSQSTEEIAPLTEEEKKQKLQELREKMQEKRAKQALLDKEEQKKNEVCSSLYPTPCIKHPANTLHPQKIRMKSTKEVQDAKEKLAQQEQIKAAAKKRQEKLDDAAAKKRIQEKIAADKEARRLKAETDKANREGRSSIPAPDVVAAPAAGSSGPKKEVTEARLRLQTNGGTVTKTFPVETTLFEVGIALEGENGGPVTSFTMTFPRKTFSGSVDFGKTLKEAGLAPSAVLIVK